MKIYHVPPGMAPNRNKLVQGKQNKLYWYSEFKKLGNLSHIRNLLLDAHYITPFCVILFLFEALLNVFIIEKIKYTEIDWVAYMQEVEGFLNGTLDYKELKGIYVNTVIKLLYILFAGDTGPLVYPAGFVYIYSLLYSITAKGSNIYLAQYIFLLVYLLQTYLIHRIFRKTLKLPPYAIIISTFTSYRIHSIFVLRLFNDPIAVLLFYISLNLFISNKWILGSLFYSLAVSVKMNILLYAPSLLLAYLTNLTILDTLKNLFICGIVQIILGSPFLYGNPYSYLKSSFDLGRVFEFKWTVNYRFLTREIFENRTFHILLLSLHVILLFIFLPLFKRYFSSYAKLRVVTDEISKQIKSENRKKKKEMATLTKKQKQFLNSFEEQLQIKEGNSQNQAEADNLSKLQDKMSKITQLFVLPFFVANLIGIACARSLHYQFYSWYFHSLVYLVFCTGYSKPFSFLLLGMIEYSWNIYPSTNFSSLLLHFCHISLLFGLYRKMKT